MIWVILVAVLIGLVLGRLMGFMAVEFLMRPLGLLTRWGTSLFGAISGWGRRLP